MSHDDEKSFGVLLTELLLACAAGEARGRDLLGDFASFMGSNQITPDERDAGIAALISVFSNHPITQGGTVVAAACILMESGGASDKLLPLVVDYCCRALRLAAEFAEHWHLEAQQYETKDFADSIQAEIKDKVKSARPIPYIAWHIAPELCRCLTLLLSASIKARVVARTCRQLIRGLEPLLQLPDSGNLPNQREYHENYLYLRLVLDVLDGEELIVIDAETRRGFRVTIEGIATVSQLIILLADALFEDASGKPPHQVVTAAKDAGVDPRFATFENKLLASSWQALNADGTVDSRNILHLLLSPAEIPVLDGMRIVILSASKFPQSWPVRRHFDRLKASLQIVELLDVSQLESWYKKIANAKELPKTE